MEQICMFVSAVGAWVTLETERDLKAYVGFIASLKRDSWYRPKIMAVKRFDFGGRVHGYNIVINDSFDEAIFRQCHEAEASA